MKMSSTNSNNNNNNNNSEEENEEMSAMRKILQSSWNIEQMGLIPSNPADAAAEAASSLSKAIDSNTHKERSYIPSNNIYMIDLLLPSYDVTKGRQVQQQQQQEQQQQQNGYDEVLAAKFCVELVENLRGRGVIQNNKASVYVREEEQRKRIQQVLDYGDIVEENILEKEEAVQEEEKDVDDFRAQLMSSWDDEIDITDKQEEQQQQEEENKNNDNSATSKEDTQSFPSKPSPAYKLRSLLGDTTKLSSPTSSGDWLNDIVTAVDYNTVHSGSNDDDVIVILAPYTPEETVAVRRIISRYAAPSPLVAEQQENQKKKKKVIVLVNCKLNPLPRELLQAELVYGILPLMVQSKVSSSSSSPLSSSSTTTPTTPPQQEKKEEKPTPKAVILKRYPKDWEVFIDVNEQGFESAGTASSGQIGNKRDPPPMEWIAGCMKMFMMEKNY